MKINKDIKYKFYLVSHEDNKPHLIFTIKIHKDNIYFINSTFIEKFKTKISYHTPRMPSNKSQVHLKINDVRYNNSDLCCPVHEIKGVRYLGGSSTSLDELVKGPVFKNNKKNEKNYIFDSRKFRISHLSSIQWSWFLVETDKEKLFYKNPMIDKEPITEFTERMHVQFIKETTPWIVIEFIRIRDESSVWYK